MKEVSNRLSGVYVDEREFLPDGENTPIKYNQLVLPLMLNGMKDELRLKLSRDQAKILYAAQILPDDADGDFLDDSDLKNKK